MNPHIPKMRFRLVGRLVLSFRSWAIRCRHETPTTMMTKTRKTTRMKTVRTSRGASESPKAISTPGPARFSADRPATRRMNGNSLAVFPYKCARTCSCHRRGKGLISAASVISTGCRPSRIVSTMSGASNVSRSIRLT